MTNLSFQMGIGVLPLFFFLQPSILNPQSPIQKTPIPNKNHQWVILSPIGDFHFQFSIREQKVEITNCW